MSVVAFLAGVVGPGVAAKAAKTAIKELTNRKRDKGEGEKEGERAEGGKETDKEDHIMGNAECPSTRPWNSIPEHRASVRTQKHLSVTSLR